MGIARQHLYYKCEIGNKCRGLSIASLEREGDHKVVEGACVTFSSN